MFVGSCNLAVAPALGIHRDDEYLKICDVCPLRESRAERLFELQVRLISQNRALFPSSTVPVAAPVNILACIT